MVWNEQRVTRETLRSTLAIGILAALLVFWGLHSRIVNTIQTNLNGIVVVVFVDYLSVLLIVFWGGYLLLTAISISPWEERSGIFDPIFEACRTTALMLYWLGSFTTMGLGTYFFVIFAYIDLIGLRSNQRIGLAFFALAGLIALVVFRKEIRRRLRKRRPRPSYIR